MTGMENRKYPLYMFDVDFETLSPPPEPEAEEDDAPPPPTFSAGELAAAREEGLATGRAEGIAQSNAGFENQIAETLEAMARTMTTLDKAQRQANDDTARAAIRLAAAAAAKLMPEYAKHHGGAEIEAFVTHCLSTLFEGAAVTVRVPEALAPEIGDRIEAIVQRTGFGEGFKLTGDPDLEPADCRIDWNDGGAARNAATLMAEIDDIVEKFLEQPPEPIPADDPPPPAENAAPTVETVTEPDPVIPAVETVTESDPVIPAADTGTELETTSPPDDLPAAGPAAEPGEATQTPPTAVDAVADQDETMKVPEIKPPAAAPAPINVAKPQKPEMPATGPVLPGAVDIDPSAT